MTKDFLLNEVAEALRGRRLTVDRIEDTFNISQGKGLRAHKAHVDPLPLVEQLSDDDETRRRQIAGYVSGIKHVLLEPTRSKADKWTFVESAGGLMPALQVSTFTLGATAAAGESPWTIDFADDLEIAYFIKLDQGLRVLTAPQVERWGVSDDRITAGARSLLFHKTRDLDFKTFEGYTNVQRLRSGDGHDASRCFVVADAFYSDVDKHFRFAMPSPDHFLAVFESTPENIAELQSASQQVYDEADYPLSNNIFHFQNGTPKPVEETVND